MTMILLTSGLVLLLTCVVFLAYEFLTFRQAAVRQLSTLGEIIAANSTASLAFDNADDAQETLAALKAEPHIVAAALYDGGGRPFAHYPDRLPVDGVPAAPAADGYRFERGHLVAFEPVVQGDNKRLGTLYLEADLGALYERLRLYGSIAALVVAVSFLVAYLLSRKLQQQISHPIVSLAEVARAVSDRQDYSVRATRLGQDELGILTDAFNHMLAQIHGQNQKLHAQLARLDLLNRITRGIGERQDPPSIFHVVIRSLEDNLSIDFGCVCLYDSAQESLTVSGVGLKSRSLASELGIGERAQIPIDPNGLARSVGGQLVYEPDVSHVKFPFPQKLAGVGLKSLILAPLVLESQVFGVLVAARREPHAFSSPDCEFIRQLSEHVALAAHQVQIYTALQQAYDDLRQSQQTVLQQERLRALGQMASGIAHDINNAISPVALYTQSLLENEPNLSSRARDYLETIERAIDDVAATVSRMREFYRQRGPQLKLAPTGLNSLVQQVLDLTRAWWSDMPLQRGVVIEIRSELAANIPPIMGAESEIREALTNLVLNAVDAMPDGGTLTIRTKVAEGARASYDDPVLRHVQVEVTDTGLGMDEETRRRCLEPFFTTKGDRGTGLGLAMVYGMVRRHSGEIEIESTVGKGTTVRLSFVVPGDVATDDESTTAYGVPSRLRILIVDDDPLLLKSLRDTLEADGHVIVTANGGQEGIDAFQAARARREPFDVAMTDLGMPYVDGRQVASAVKQASPCTPVILLTGWGQRLAAEGDVPPHVDHLISKPPKLRDLREALAHCGQLAAS
jgi:signal transduction histidine kinase/CheY-like chemotaxis protein